MAHEGFHEPVELLDDRTMDMHRAIESLAEELEAIDWYAQRITATGDPDLASVLAHNRDDEKEHAAMALEWLRRRDPELDAQLRKYLFTSDPIVALSPDTPAAEGDADAGGDDGAGSGSLGIGSLKGQS